MMVPVACRQRFAAGFRVFMAMPDGKQIVQEHPAVMPLLGAETGRFSRQQGRGAFPLSEAYPLAASRENISRFNEMAGTA
jgi:hypothetical protein